MAHPVAETFSTPYWIVWHDARIDIEWALPESTCGKWMRQYEAQDSSWIYECIKAAVEDGACVEAKMSTPLQMEGYDGTGVACFYIDGSKPEQHRRLISFMLENDLFERDDDGYLLDAPFRFDWQTAAGLYGDDFVPEMTLGDFVDLSTGHFLDAKTG